MKRIFNYYLFFFMTTYIALSNPIKISFINEIGFSSNDFMIELHQSNYFGPINLANYYIKTSSDSALFKPGLILDTQYLVITKNSLRKTLLYNANGDIISLFNSSGSKLDEIRFGNILYSQICCPKPNQSISFFSELNSPLTNSYYLDNSPTFGYKNDTINSNGILKGFVYDKLNNPLNNVSIIYNSYFDSHGFYFVDSVVTNELGNFNILFIARNVRLTFKKDGYKDSTINLQFQPDSTQNMNMYLDMISFIDNNQTDENFNFKLYQNYPNPIGRYNSTGNIKTKISFQTPKTESINITNTDFSINIYDILGTRIEKIIVPNNNFNGTYEIEWNGEKYSPGIYFYELEYGKLKMSKKMILLK